MTKERFPQPEERGAEQDLEKVNKYFDFSGQELFAQELDPQASMYAELKKEIRDNAREVAQEFFEKIKNSEGEERNNYIFGLRRLGGIIGFDAKTEIFDELGIDEEKLKTK